MASVAAVAANQAKSPQRNDIGEDGGHPGEITSGIYGGDEELADADEDEDELPANPLRSRKLPNRSNENTGTGAGGDPLDLFGDEEQEEAEESAVRQLDDDELDLDDEIERGERILQEAEQEAEQEYVAQERVTMDLEIPRQPIPEPSDGEMYLLKVPDFMSIEPHAWDHKTFQPPTTDHHSRKKPSATFSSFTTALTTIRWRHSPSQPSHLQSNARINRWEDGSLTLQLASDPTTHYEIDANSLVPPQRNPIKPTPTSIHGGPKDTKSRASQEADSYTYLFRPDEASSTLIATHKLTAGLTVKQSEKIQDDAIERLQASLAAASNAKKVNGATGIDLVQIDEDPEMAKAKALQAVKEKERAEKRRLAAIERESARSNRVLGRAGLGPSRYSGLNVGMLEDDEMGDEGGQRGRPSPHKNRGQQQRRRRRNSEYSEDEDFGRKKFSYEDEYDEEDDFVAPSDEEEVIEDDEDPDDGIVESNDERGGRDRGRERTPKRAREDEAEDDDEADAPGEVDDTVEAVVRTKRRRIVEDEEEE